MIVAVIGIAVLLFGWVWLQERAAREKCEGLIDKEACALNPGCHGCVRAGTESRSRLHKETVNRSNDGSLVGRRRPFLDRTVKKATKRPERDLRKDQSSAS